MILEGMVTTQSTLGSVNLAPMGPIVDAPMQRLVLRPYTSSTTYRNIKATGCGVFHVVDDVLLLAQAAINKLPSLPPLVPAEKIVGQVLADCCRWYEFTVASLDDSSERTTIVVEIVHTGRRYDFFGFNRAKHAVLEAAILATRVHILPIPEILIDLDRLAVPVEKTGGDREKESFTLLHEYVKQAAAKLAAAQQSSTPKAAAGA